MRKFFKFRSYNKILKYLSIPLIAMLSLSLIYVATNLFFTNSNDFIISLKDASENLMDIFPLMLSPFLSYCFSKRNKALSAFVSLISVLLFDSIFFSITGFKCGILVGILVGILTPIILNAFENFKLTAILALIISIMVAILVSMIFPFYSDFLTLVAEKISNSLFAPFWFGILKNVAAFLPGEDLFANLFFEKSFGGAIFSNRDFITGAKNVFQNELLKGNSISGNASKYLCGNFVVSIFFVLGSSISMYSNMKNEKQKSNLLFFITLLTILSGNILPYSVFILFMNPVLFLLLIGVSGISYLVCSLLVVKIGYLFCGGLTEYAFFASKCELRNSMMIMLIGFVVAIMSYSMVKLCIERFGVSADINDAVIDSELVKSLGGIDNIDSIKTSKGKVTVVVKNQNILNIVYLNSNSYSVSANTVVAKFKDYDEYNEFYDRIMLLKKYI